jgi:hypothetical protein
MPSGRAIPWRLITARVFMLPATLLFFIPALIGCACINILDAIYDNAEL